VLVLVLLDTDEVEDIARSFLFRNSGPADI
jgi:hypothetical protein